MGQGALGIEICVNRPDLIATLAPLNHPDTQVCVEAERGMSRALAGSCTVPLGAYAASVDGKQMLVETVVGSRIGAEALGKALANQLVAKGADKILASL